MAVANAEPTDRIRAFILSRIRQGQRYFKSKEIGKAIGLDPHAVGTRLSAMEKKGDVSLRVSRWADKVWAVEAI